MAKVTREEIDEIDRLDKLSAELRAAYNNMWSRGAVDSDVDIDFGETIDALEALRRNLRTTKMEDKKGEEFWINIKLEQLKVPEFISKVEDWESFHDLFKTFVL